MGAAAAAAVPCGAPKANKAVGIRPVKIGAAGPLYLLLVYIIKESEIKVNAGSLF